VRLPTVGRAPDLFYLCRFRILLCETFWHERFLSHLGLAPDAASFAAAADVPEASRITSDAVSDNVSDAVSDRRTTASAFRARRIDPFDVQQRVMYERGGELELWEVTLDE